MGMITCIRHKREVKCCDGCAACPKCEAAPGEKKGARWSTMKIQQGEYTIPYYLCPECRERVKERRKERASPTT